MPQYNHIEIGDQVYVVEGGEKFGAVRGYMPQANALVIYIENAGDFVVPLEAVHVITHAPRRDFVQSWGQPRHSHVPFPGSASLWESGLLNATSPVFVG
jgi:hypothetical protein